MMHAKVLIVDGEWTVLGTTNMDNRSFEHNDEVNLTRADVAARLLDTIGATSRRATRSRCALEGDDRLGKTSRAVHLDLGGSSGRRDERCQRPPAGRSADRDLQHPPSRGMDRRISPARIAEVLRKIDADIVALQEVVGAGPSGSVRPRRSARRSVWAG